MLRETSEANAVDARERGFHLERRERAPAISRSPRFARLKRPHRSSGGAEEEAVELDLLVTGHERRLQLRPRATVIAAERAHARFREDDHSAGGRIKLLD
jgi:hypothetical protein